MRSIETPLTLYTFPFQNRKFSEVSVEVKKSQHKYIIGPKGNSINEILEETGVFVEMPNVDTASETITLRGPQEKLGLGKYLEINKYSYIFGCHDDKICLELSRNP